MVLSWTSSCLVESNDDVFLRHAQPEVFGNFFSLTKTKTAYYQKKYENKNLPMIIVCADLWNIKYNND